MNKSNQKKQKDIMFIIGIFFAVFAVSIFVAILYTETDRGKLVNFICACLFVVVSLISFLVSKKNEARNETIRN